MNGTQKFISQFHKNSIELVKINLGEWRSQPYVDIRIWILGNPAEPGSGVATKKGIRLTADLLPKLIDALKKAQEALNEGSRTHKKEE